MVNSPATAATMAYPTLEEERRSSWHEQHGNDHGGCRRRRRRRQRQRNAGQAVDYHETETLRRDLDSFTAVCSPCIEQHDDHRHVHDESCTGCHSRGSTATILNRDFAHSYHQPVAGPSKHQSLELPTELPCPANGRIQRRSRKQSQPRKVTEIVEEDEDLISPGEGIKQEEKEEEEEREKEGEATEKPESQMAILKKKYRTPSKRGKRSLKCHQCPKNSFASGCVCPPYHTKASLVLHNLWRHNKRTRSRLENQAPNNDNPVSQVSSITLKATVYTNPARYDYHR